MKGFTIKLPKQNIDPQGSLKNRILNEVKNRLPFAKWYGIHTPEDPEYSVSYAGPEDLLCFGCNRNAHFSAFNKKYYPSRYAFISFPDIGAQEPFSTMAAFLFWKFLIFR